MSASVARRALEPRATAAGPPELPSRAQPGTQLRLFEQCASCFRSPRPMLVEGHRDRQRRAPRGSAGPRGTPGRRRGSFSMPARPRREITATRFPDPG